MGIWTTIAPSEHSAYLATPDRSRSGRSRFHAWWGLNQDVSVFAICWRAQGFVALAPSLYPDGRTAAEHFGRGITHRGAR